MWTDNGSSLKFSKMGWLDETEFKMFYIGDSLQATNGAGQVVNMVYRCEIDGANNAVISLHAVPGYLDGKGVIHHANTASK